MIFIYLYIYIYIFFLYCSRQCPTAIAVIIISILISICYKLAYVLTPHFFHRVLTNMTDWSLICIFVIKVNIFNTGRMYSGA